jgi:hypothetical protein
MNFSDQIREVDKLVTNGHYVQAVITAGSLLEALLKSLYGQVFPKLPPGEQQKVIKKVETIGRGKPVSDFTLGQLLGLYRETQLFDQSQAVLGRDLPHLRSANYNLFLDLRNRATHQGAVVEEDEARLYASQVRVFLREVGYIESPKKPTTGPLPSLRPWSQLVRLHPDVERGDMARATYAIDLGALVANDPNVPQVYRQAGDFFAATHLTTGLRRLLTEVLAGLTGGSGDRVLQLRSPFGGGKSHALATLYHAAINRAALGDPSLPDPDPVRVAVFDGEKFDVQGRLVKGQQVQTVWGLLAAQLECYPVMAYHDQNRIPPGGDKIAEMLGNTPTLLLLDEVLKYIEDVLAEKVGDSTLGRLTQSFLQSLSVEVARTPTAVLVYSLQISGHEAFGNVALLNMLDHLAARLDAKREPVAGDEILAVLRRRLLGELPPSAVSTAAAEAYASAITRMRTAHAIDEAERRAAEDDRLALRDRLAAAYPFHPALIDVMRERWASLPDFQRTRGALRFLAVCLHVLKRDNRAVALLGPGDIPIADGDVANAFFTEVGQKDAFKAVLQRDFTGPNARIQRIDNRLAREHPNLSGVRPALRLATAILAYSFGGPQRAGVEGGEPMAPGVGESELLAGVVGPDLDSLTAQAVLKELREQCLYLHYDGARYVFKTTPNINQILEEEADRVRPTDIERAIEEELNRRLAGRPGARLWPKNSLEITDLESRFVLAYLPLDFGLYSEPVQTEQARDLLSQHGDRPRRYRNGVGLAVPDRDQVEPLRRAVRYLQAVERVKAKRVQLNLTTPQMQQLDERQRTEATARESSLRNLYQSVWLPLVGEGGQLNLEKVIVSGRPLAAQTIHERLIELLTIVSPPRLFTSVTPEKIVELMRLGQGDNAAFGVSVAQIIESFYSVLGFPRLESEIILRRAIVKGVRDSVFGYVSRTDPARSGWQKEESSPYLVTARQARLEVDLPEDEIDVSSAAIVLPQAIAPEIPVEPTPVSPTPSGPTPPGSRPAGPTPPLTGPTPTPSGIPATTVRLKMRMTRQQLYASFNAIGNLADKAGAIRVTVEAEKLDGFDPNWLRNAVLEPLDEADVDVEE